MNVNKWMWGRGYQFQAPDSYSQFIQYYRMDNTTQVMIMDLKSTEQMQDDFKGPR